MRSEIQGNYLNELKLLWTVINQFLITNRWLCSWISFQFGSFTAISVMLYLHQFSLSLWIGTGAFGLFMSSVFPTTLALAEYYIDVTGKAVANQLKSDFAFFETSGRLSQVALFVNRLFTLSIKREIRQFYVVVLKWPQRNLQKARCTCRVVVDCFANLNLLLFWRSCRHRRRDKNSLLSNDSLPWERRCMCLLIRCQNTLLYPPNSRFRLDQKESRAKRVKTMISVQVNTVGGDIELTRSLSYKEWQIFFSLWVCRIFRFNNKYPDREFCNRGDGISTSCRKGDPY